MTQFKYIMVVFLILTSMPSVAEIYRWVDEHGQVHFGDKPKGNDYEVIKPDGGDQKDNKNHGSSDEERSVEAEKARQERIKKMEALAEQLKADREAREGEREKEKKELEALRVGCATAFERINTLEKQIRHYIVSKSQITNSRARTNDPKDIALDTKHQRMAAELDTRKKYVEENCQDL